MRIPVGALVVASCLAGLAASGCGARPAASPARQSDIPLAQGEYVDLALARDGTVWITDSYGSLVHVGKAGGVSEHRLEWDDFPGDIVQGPDGAMWFGTDGTLSRIDQKGNITSSGISAWPRVLTNADDALWFLDSDSSPPRVERVDGDGNVTRNVSLPVQPTEFDFGGLAAGPDDSVWFTETSYSPENHDAVGRVTAEGAYERLRLPRVHSSPGRITEGPDGALWFTEELGQRIGRITPDGKITEYDLHPEVNPTDIVVGRDDALWFASDTCLGRITTDGDVVMWPVDRARGLVRMETAPDGSFWLLDAVGTALRHYTPPEPAVASDAECEPPSAEAEADSTKAVVSYKPLDQLSSGEDFFTDARVRILREGKEVFREAVPQENDYSVYGYSGGLAVRDLDGDGEPEVKLELNWNGTHCCEWSRIYRYIPSRGTYVTSTHMWGEAYATPSVKDLDDDGRPEFLSKDDRFSALTGYAGVRAPIQVWSYDRGKFTDVTRRFPKEIERDAAVLWQDYLKYRKGGARYVLAAWAADEYMLGRADTVESVLAAALERGELDPELGVASGGADYLRMLKGFLRRAGYS